MKITTTYREIMDKGLWEKFCELTGTSVYCVNEGADPKSEVVLLEHEAKIIGLLKEEK